jgi:hypothetical protein
MNDISFKVENYNKTINKIYNILGEGYNDLIKYLSIYGVYNDNEKKSIKESIILSVGTYYNGWFEKYDINKSWNWDNLDRKYIFTFSDLKRILLNDYSTEYSGCYKTGELNEEQLLNLVIRVIESKLISAHKFSLDLYDNINDIPNEPNNSISKLLNNQSNDNDKLCILIKLIKDTKEDIDTFQNILFKLLLLKGNFEYTEREEIINNLSEEDKSKLDILINVLKVYTISDEQLVLIENLLHPNIVSSIKDSIENFTTIDVFNNVDSKTKVLIK